MLIKAYDMWSNRLANYPGRIKNEQDEPLCGFRLKEGKQYNTMQVLNNGHILGSYRYPNVEIPFQSPMVRWWNLLYCGGYAVQGSENQNLSQNSYLLEDVLAQKKPMGYAIYSDSNALQQSALNNSDVVARIEKTRYVVGKSELGVTQKGKVSDWFDIEALIQSYEMLARKAGWEENEFLNPFTKEQLRSLKEKKFEDLLFSYDYANPGTDYQYILTGLTLGFPIESTYALLTENIK